MGNEALAVDIARSHNDGRVCQYEKIRYMMMNTFTPSINHPLCGQNPQKGRGSGSVKVSMKRVVLSKECSFVNNLRMVRGDY